MQKRRSSFACNSFSSSDSNWHVVIIFFFLLHSDRKDTISFFFFFKDDHARIQLADADVDDDNSDYINASPIVSSIRGQIQILGQWKTNRLSLFSLLSIFFFLFILLVGFESKMQIYRNTRANGKYHKCILANGLGTRIMRHCSFGSTKWEWRQRWKGKK